LNASKKPPQFAFNSIKANASKKSQQFAFTSILIITLGCQLMEGYLKQVFPKSDNPVELIPKSDNPVESPVRRAGKTTLIASSVDTIQATFSDVLRSRGSDLPCATVTSMANLRIKF
jgi:hypothetical protein